jgi:hypothetical protein
MEQFKTTENSELLGAASLAPRIGTLYFCALYEKEAVARLSRPRRRPDNRLTPTEHARVSRFFALIWPFLMEEDKECDGVREQMARMHPKDIFCIREVVIFIILNVDEQGSVEVAHLMGDDLRKGGSRPSAVIE